VRRFALALLVLSLAGCGGGEKTDRIAERVMREDGEVASFDGVPIAYTVAGDGAGALLFIHGWSGDRHYWTAQIDAFAGEQRVVAVDLAGHGDSGRDRADWTVGSLARDVRAVIESLDLGSVVLIGHSMGGVVALEVARRMPERVVGVIGVDSFHDVEHRAAGTRSELLAGLRQDFPGRCRAYVEAMFLEDADPELVREVSADMCESPPDVAIALLERLPEYDLTGALSEVRVPVRAINGSLGPTHIEIVREYDPDFDAFVLPGTGHFPMLERPDEFNRLLRAVIEELTAGATT